MNKLLKATSALAFIFLSSQTFASNIDEFELGLYRQGFSKIQVDNIIITLRQNSAITSVSEPVSVKPTFSTVSVTPTNTLEEAVQDVFVNMANLSTPGTTDHNIFEDIYLEVHGRIYARTGAGSKDYSIIEWINKIKGSRLYNPVCWGEFQKKDYAHDQCDINMVSSGEQLSNIQAIFYKAFYEKSQKKIIELHEVGARDNRSIQEIIDSMSRAKTATIDQQVVNNIMHVKKNIFGF